MHAAAVASVFSEGIRSRVSLQQHTDARPSKNLALSHSLYVRSHATLEVCTSLLLLLLLEMPHIIFEMDILSWYSSQVPTSGEVYFAYICVSTISQPCSSYLQQQNIVIEYFRALFERWWKNLKGSSENRLVFLTKNLDNRPVLLFGMPVCMLFAS